MSTEALFLPLAAAAATIGSLHSLAPDHWLPIAAVGRARHWSTGRTARVALLCGAGHVTVSVVLGLIGLAVGVATASSFGDKTASLAGALLVVFGLVYGLVGARHALMHRYHGDHHHHHHHDHVHDPGKLGVWALFAIYCADACVAMIPILFAAASLSVAETIAIIAIYEVATVGTMVVMVALAREGVGLLRGRWTELWGDSVAGASIAATGIAVALLGI